MTFNKAKCQVLHLVRNNQIQVVQGWVRAARKLASKKGPVGDGQQPVEHELTVCPNG